jgi:hypothetical protein
LLVEEEEEEEEENEELFAKWLKLSATKEKRDLQMAQIICL